MSNQVTIKLDSRVFYAVVALVAVVGIFAIGWFLGTQLNKPATPVANAPAAANPAAPNPNAPAGGANPVVGTPEVAAQQVAQVKGAKPVSITEVPVGESEPRLALPDLEPTNYAYDFGKIPADQVAEKDFVVKNAGTAELVIEEATASCGCTAALVKDSNVGPGQETTVRVAYDPRVNREAGRFITKQVRIKSNDPLVPLAEFTITADVASQ
jgi:hypothetical protein